MNRRRNFFLAALVGAVAGCGAKPPLVHEPAALPAVSVRVQTVTNQLVTAIEEVSGTVRTKVHATLEAKLSGRLEQVPVHLGQAVHAGDLLARLDAKEIQARLDQAEAALDQANRDWTRITALLAQQTISRAEADTAQARQRVAQAAVVEARTMLGYVEVVAPFDGVVTRKWAEAGDFATPGKPLIELENPADLQLEADVPESLAARLQLGARLAVRAEAVTGDWAGVISELAPAADPASRTFRVKLDLPPTPGRLSGRFARLLVPAGEGVALRVPATAMVRRGQMEMVFVVAQQRAVLRLVRTGGRIGDELEILAGLDAGEVVVVDGAARLSDGQSVSIQNSIQNQE